MAMAASILPSWAVRAIRPGSVCLGNGNGSFYQLGAFYDAGIPYDITSGDFNGDAILDLAVASFDTADVRLGNGDGTFTAFTSYDTTKVSTAVETADLSGDGVLDLVLTHRFGGNSGVDVLLGNPNGTFESSNKYVSGANPLAVTIRDFTADGVPDVAVANGVPGSGTIALLAGAGGGAFQSLESFLGEKEPNAITTADLNGDQDPDLLIANNIPPSYTNYALTVQMGAAGTTFSIANYYAGFTASVLHGTPGGRFQIAPDYGGGGFDMTVGDFNRDGVLDLAFTHKDYGSQKQTVSIQIGVGDGTFESPVDYDAGNGTAIISEDFNGDGILDLAVGHYLATTIAILLGNGDGTFQAKVNYDAGHNTMSLAAADLNGDGFLDLVAAYEFQNTVTVHLGNGDGTFKPMQSYAAGNEPEGVDIGDLNGDGKPDLAVMNVKGGTVSVLVGNGDGSFQPPVGYAFGSAYSLAHDVALGDFDADGNLDLAVSWSELYTTNSLSTLLGNGDGSFQAPVRYAMGEGPQDVDVVDWNSDGILDVVVANGWGVAVVSGHGGGSFDPAVNYIGSGCSRSLPWNHAALCRVFGRLPC
jgi:VCBS repeat protein